MGGTCYFGYRIVSKTGIVLNFFGRSIVSNRKISSGGGAAAEASIDQAKAALAAHHLARKVFSFVFITLTHGVE